MDKIISDNWGLIVRIAKLYRPLCVNNPALSFEDLTQAGAIGVISAAHTFDTERGAWATWAAWHIRKEIRSAVGIRSGNLTHISALSIDRPLNDDAEATLGDTIADGGRTPEEQAMLEAERGIIVAALKGLPDQERQLAEYMRQGLKVSEACRRMGISPQRGAQLRKSMRKHLAQLPAVCEILNIETNTNYYRHKGVAAFHSTGSSAVEDAFFARERMREYLCQNSELIYRP